MTNTQQANETRQCPAGSWEDAFLRTIAEQIEEGQINADKHDTLTGGVEGSMQLMALMAEQSMTHLESTRMLIQALSQRLTEAEARLTEPEYDDDDDDDDDLW